MRLFVFYTLCLAGLLETAWSQSTNWALSRNVAGFAKVALPPAGGYNCVAANFVSWGGSPIALAAMVGTNQWVRDAVYARADKIHVWNAGSQEFERYAQKPSGEFVKLEDWATGPASAPVLAAGAGLWIQSSPTATNLRDIVLMGEVVSTGIVSTLMRPGYQCIGSPFSAELALTNNDWLADGAAGHNTATNADQLIVWNGNGFDRLGLAADGRWYAWTNWITQGGGPVDRRVTVGQGVWYLSKTNTSWVWTQAKPYSSP